MCAGLCLALVLTGCKSKESAYKKAYEKAKAQDEAVQASTPTQQETPVVAPLTEQPATQTTVDNASVRTEDVTLVSGDGLQAYSVVTGSFGLKANADRAQAALQAAGYKAQIVKNTARNLYRVVAATYANKADAVRVRNEIRGTKYNPDSDAWLLFKK
jgi:cell division protein FtsN